MKIETNFSNMPQPPVRWIVGLLALIVVLTIFYSVSLGVSSYQYREHSEQLEKRKLKLGEHITAMGEIKPDSLPDNQEFESFKKNAAVIESLNKNKGMDPSLVLARLEHVLPKAAYLVSVQYQRESGEVMLVAESARTAPLALFLHQLEQDAAFEGVLLLRQLQEGAGNQKRIRYSIKFRGGLL